MIRGAFDTALIDDACAVDVYEFGLPVKLVDAAEPLVSAQGRDASVTVAATVT